MASYDGSILIETKVDGTGVKKGIGSISKEAKNMKTSFAGLGKAVAGAFAVKVLYDFGKQAVSLASDLQEVQNVVDVAFGDMAYKVEEFAKSSIRTMGISELTAKKTASTYMSMGKGMGLAVEDAFNMSLSLTQLSADMASFYNISQERADIALKSVYTGETETLKQYGIVMTQVNLEQYALSKGINKSLSSMNQQEMAMLRYNYVLEQTKLAQGDFVRTGGSWANQTRVLAEQWKQLMTIVGNGLIKVLTPLVAVLNQIVSSMISFANSIATVFGGQTYQAEQTSKAIESSVGSQEDLTKATEKTNKEAKKTTASFDEIQKLTENTSEGGAGAGGGGATSALSVAPFEIKSTEELEGNLDGISAKLETIKRDLISFMQPFQKLKMPFDLWIKNDIPQLIKEVKKLGQEIYKGLSETLSIVLPDLRDNVVVPMLNTLLTSILPMYTQIGTEITKTLTESFTIFNKLFQNIWSTGIAPSLKIFTKIWDETWDTIYSTWQKWGSPIFDNVREAIGNIGNTLQIAYDKYWRPIWENFMQMVDWLWTDHLQPLMANIGDFVGEFINGALEIYNKFITPLVNAFLNYFSPQLRNSLDLIMNLVGTTVAYMADALNSFVTTLKGVVQFITGVFTLDWEKAWEGIKTIVKGKWDGIKNIVKTAINFVIDFVNAMITAVIDGLNYVIDAVNKLSFDVPDWVPGIGGETFGFELDKLNANNYKIPKLAQGTVIPANYGNFLATLGDNKKAPEIVSPLPTMKQAFAEALAENGQNITIRFEEGSIGDLVRVLKPYIDKETKRVGNSMRLGGAY